jgi:hypothetical protein
MMLSTGSTSSIRNRVCRRLELKQTSEGAELLGLLIDRSRVLFKGLEVSRPDSLLEFVDRGRVEKMVFTIATPLVMPSRIQNVRIAVSDAKGRLMTQEHLGGDFLQATPSILDEVHVK